jgi:hypothetical protein
MFVSYTHKCCYHSLHILNFWGKLKLILLISESSTIFNISNVFATERRDLKPVLIKIFIVFIVAMCSLKIHSVLHTNECTNYVLYISIKIITLKHLKCSYMFRSLDHPQGAHIVPC